MFFVNKTNPLHYIDISAIEQSILIDTKKDVAAEIKSAFIDKLHLLKKDFWIACDCQETARLIICSVRGNLYIRCKKLDEHLQACYFIKSSTTICNQFSSPSSSRIKQYNLYQTITDIASSEDNYNFEGKQANSSKHSIGKLGQVLYTVLEDSKTNVIAPSTKLSLLSQLTQITNSFMDHKKLIWQNIPLGKYYRYSLSDESLLIAEQHLLKSARFFPSFVQPFTLFSLVTADISNNSFTTKKSNKTFNILNPITTTSNWINLQKSSPYLLLVAAVLNQQSKLVFQDAFAMPILSTACLMPIESNYERSILKVLLRISLDYPNICIKKPLFDLFTKNSLKFRPDFIVYYQGREIFIEVLGSNDPNYLNHKSAIALRAKEHCDSYISVKGFDLQNDYNNFVNQLQFALK